MDQANKQIFEKYKKLPKELQGVITDIHTTDVIQAVGKKYNLSVDKIGQLDDEVGLLMLGETRPNDFINNLGRRLETDTETTKKIAQEINEQVFSKVRESLKKIHAINENETLSAPTPTPSPQPTQPQQTKSLFEQKLEEGVFKPTERPLVKEVEEAKKENRYPSSEDPYREETTNI